MCSHRRSALLLRHGRQPVVGGADRGLLPGRRTQVESRGDRRRGWLLPRGGVVTAGRQDGGCIGAAPVHGRRADWNVSRRQWCRRRRGDDDVGRVPDRAARCLPARRHQPRGGRLCRHVPHSSRPVHGVSARRNATARETNGEDRRVRRDLYRAGDVCRRVLVLRGVVRASLEAGVPSYALLAGTGRRARVGLSAGGVDGAGRGRRAARAGVVDSRCDVVRLGVFVQDIPIVAQILLAARV